MGFEGGIQAEGNTILDTQVEMENSGLGRYIMTHLVLARRTITRMTHLVIWTSLYVVPAP